MILQDMKAGQPVTLELIWGAQSYDIKTSVVGTNENGVLIKPFIYNGVVINLPENKMKDIVFNIYAIDPETGTRKAWKNASVKPVVYRGRTYYACSVSKFQQNASHSERRNHQRMDLNVNGVLVGAVAGKDYPIRVRDISDNGVGFLMDKDVDLTKSNFKINFHDKARGTSFNLTIECRNVREMPQGEEILYGCRIIDASKDLLMYVFMKRMEMR